jgi:UDP-N-acetylmuramoyl-L-alanine---L-glutamate ligase
MNPVSAIIDFFANRNILILGYGREGQSSYKLIRKFLPYQLLTIADKKQIDFIDSNVTLITGENYLDSLNSFDIILKSPGITLKNLTFSLDYSKITSQTDIFLQYFAGQTIGVTGTKGKSTTTSLIHHILTNVRPNVLLGGNIGIPLFDLIETIDEETLIVSELSAHQLEFIDNAPHISVLLNLYQEHLDHFINFEHYIQSKWNIHRFQNENDFFIYNHDDSTISLSADLHTVTNKFLPFSRFETLLNGAYIENENIISVQNGVCKNKYNTNQFKNLPGKHNFYNIMAAILVCEQCGIDPKEIDKHIRTFQGLEHRIEYIGFFHEIHFFNDSISTIPEATISALEALYNVDTLILGGFDRGIDYHSLYQYLNHHSVSTIIFTGPAGKRMYEEWSEMSTIKQKVCIVKNFDQVFDYCYQNTPMGGKCLLSPAAASYDEFKNFQERGTYFKNKIMNK